MKIFLTGGSGFIGSAVVKTAIEEGHQVLNLDALTYSGCEETNKQISTNPNYRFVEGDIRDSELVDKLLADFQPDGLMHLAAESHVDRSIDGPEEFISTNILGTFKLLQSARKYLDNNPNKNFRFHHISTDEVFGSLSSEGFFTETTAYDPRSPYSASKASSDMLVRAWGHTFELPVVITNCSNNYGPFQYPEKLIPTMILNCYHNRKLPVYGQGSNIRDWLHVEDHARALLLVLQQGKVGETYCIGGNNEKTNLDVVHAICDLVDELSPNKSGDVKSRRDLIEFVTDRPGHDFRYAIDCSKIKKDLGWEPVETFESGLRKTVLWYLEEMNGWCKVVSADKVADQRRGTK